MSIFHTVINDTLGEAEGEGVADLCRLNEAMGYWAPEVRESRFWFGHGGILGYQDILNSFFSENQRVRAIYRNFLETHYKDNLVQV
jgi:hypothetical protein